MMIESQNTEINVNELMEKLRLEVTNRKSTFPTQTNVSNSLETHDSFLPYFYRIEALLNNSELYSQVPIELPEKINRYLFKIGFIKKLILKVYGFIFKKQRVVNVNLIQAFRESLHMNQRLIDKLNSTQARLDAMETKINLNEAKLAKDQSVLDITETMLDLETRK
jgi:O-antigen chain-terminating methyltransferase